jgi:hypothetical protein
MGHKFVPGVNLEDADDLAAAADAAASGAAAALSVLTNLVARCFRGQKQQTVDPEYEPTTYSQYRTKN